MTTVVAVKKGNGICIGSDGLTLFGHRREVAGRHVVGNGKIIQVGNQWVGFSGDASWGLVLSHYFAGCKAKDWKDEGEIFDVVSGLHRALKERYFFIPPTLSFLPFESSEFHLLIVNRWGIFDVDYARVVRKFTQFHAIGTGDGYALGAMQAVFGMVESAEEVAEEGLRAACRFDRKSEGPLFLRTAHSSA